MTAAKKERIYETLDAEFQIKLIDVMRKKFNIEVENNYSIFAMALVTTRVDGKDFTVEQYEWLSAYSLGYNDAMQIVMGWK